MFIEITWTKILLATLSLVLFRFLCVLFPLSKNKKSWNVVWKKEVIGHLNDKPPWRERLHAWAWDGVRYIPTKEKDF